MHVRDLLSEDRTHLSLLLFLLLHLLLHLLHFSLLLLLFGALRIAGVAGAWAESGLVLVPVLAILLLSGDLRDFDAQRRRWSGCVHDSHSMRLGPVVTSACL
jgi:hypothetical protein